MRAPTMTSPAHSTQSVFSLRRLRVGIAALMTAALTACGGGGEIGVDPPSTAVFVTNPRALPAEYFARQAVAYGPYRDNLGPRSPASVVTSANIEQDMRLLAAGSWAAASTITGRSVRSAYVSASSATSSVPRPGPTTKA